MVPFAGYEMPVQYSGIVDEHRTVREAAGIFDVSHMGRLEIQGAGAGDLLRYVCSWDMKRLNPGQGHYAAMCRPDGGILDDVYVFCVEPGRYLTVANASNAGKVEDWIGTYIGGFEATISDRQRGTAMVAAQGPKALGLVEGVIGGEFVRSLRPRRCGENTWRGSRLFASRTGYTGEDGLEMVVDVEHGPILWRALLDAGLRPCGLGARDTLRLEASLLLYGNDIDEETNPWEVGLGWVVTLDDGVDFVGRDALVRLKEEGVGRALVCVRADGKGVMRSGCPILQDGREIGKVTSGGYSPTLGVSVGMGMVSAECAEEGAALTVDVRGRPLTVTVVPRPFYKRSSPE
jgi:aminomethyltransferase